MWFVIQRGAWLLSQEKALLDRILKNKRGNDLLQIGGSKGVCFTENARVARTFFLDNQCQFENEKSFIQGNADALPIQSESIDIVLLIHQFDAIQNPMTILQEVHRVLRPNGQIMTVGFNKWGLHNFLNCSQKRCSMGRIKRCMRALSFEITMQHTLCFWPPFLLMETLGQFFLPYAGNIYFLSATKNIQGMTPLISKNYGRVAKLMEVGAQATTK